MKTWGFLFLMLISGVLSAQDTRETQIDLEQFAERLFQVQDEDVGYEDIYESLLLFYTDPLNLNRASEEELSSLYILSPSQVQALLDHRESFGDLLSIYELQAIEGFDLSLIQELLPFVTVQESSSDNRTLLQRMSQEQNKYLLLRYSRVLEEQRGFREEEENGYIGDQNKIYGRFRMSRRNDFSAGVTFEKDQGEEMLQNGQFDFMSAHFMLENQGPISKVIVGDYQLQVGQGLIFGAGFNPGKGAETVNTVKRNTLGVRPYTSVLETGFFRGAAAAVPVGNFTITGFYSSLNQDGNIQIDSLDAFEAFASSIQSSGFHRTASELENKDQILEHSMGGVIEFEPTRKLKLGVSGISTTYSAALKRMDAPYNLYEFKGKENSVIGGFGSYQLQNLNFFGEVARSSSGGIGAVGGVISSLSRTIDMAISVRDYDRNFHTFYGNAFGEGSRAINERGIYWGIKFKPSRRYTVAAYYDKFEFPWLRFGTDAPSQGAEWLARFTYQPDRNVTTYVQVREEKKEISRTVGNLSELELRTKRNYIFNIDYKLNSALSMKTRVQTSTQNLAGEFTKGYAIIQDLNYQFGKFKLSGRTALFETDDYDNRQYVYERDVLYAFSIPAYNGVGIRNYILLQFSATRQIDLYVRYAQFSYRDRDEVGSGLDVTEGPIRSEVKWMMRIML